MMVILGGDPPGPFVSAGCVAESNVFVHSWTIAVLVESPAMMSTSCLLGLEFCASGYHPSGS